jgi:hypothetical protein
VVTWLKLVELIYSDRPLAMPFAKADATVFAARISPHSGVAVFAGQEE